MPAPTDPAQRDGAGGADRGPSDHGNRKVRDNRPDSDRSGGHRRDGHPQGRQRSRVVEEALSFQDRDGSTWHAGPPGDRRGGEGVRRSDDCAHGNSRGQRDSRQHSNEGERHGRRREQHQPDREHHDGSANLAQPDIRRAEGSGEQQWRQQHEQHKIRVDLDSRHPRQSRHHQPGQDQQHGSRHPQRDGEPGDGDHSNDQGDERRDVLHPVILPRRRRSSTECLRHGTRGLA
jgi:hypothetical protein